jgi:hypothetical protein
VVAEDYVYFGRALHSVLVCCPGELLRGDALLLAMDQ